MTRMCPRRGVIEAAFCPTCGERTIPGSDTGSLRHSLRLLALVGLFTTAIGVGGFFLARLAISQNRQAQAVAEARTRLIESLPDGWRFAYAAVSRLNDYTQRATVLKSYSEDSRLDLPPLNHEQVELFMSLFGDPCWESNKRAAFDVLVRYVDSGGSVPAYEHADRQ